METTIRELVPGDMDSVMDIELVSNDTPITGQQFARLLRRRNIVGFVASTDDKIIGFIVIEIFKDNFRILNIAVSPDYRRLGAGRKLLGFLTSQLKADKQSKAVIMVRETGLASQLFLKACGFKAVTIMHSYYSDTEEDCYRMEFAHEKTKAKPKTRKKKS
jgi:ribosomal-protein-alanine N-acetyltransferase